MTTSFIKRRVNMNMSGCYDITDDSHVRIMLKDNYEDTQK